MLICLMMTLLLSLLLAAATPHSVTVTITTTGEARGNLRLAVYATAEDFALDRSLVAAVQPLTSSSANVEVDLPAAGAYVFAAFQDLNGNGELDTNLWGVPTEPYGFTKTPPSKWRAPSFGEVATRIAGPTANASIQLRTWKEY